MAYHHHHPRLLQSLTRPTHIKLLTNRFPLNQHHFHSRTTTTTRLTSRIPTTQSSSFKTHANQLNQCKIPTAKTTTTTETKTETETTATKNDQPPKAISTVSLSDLRRLIRLAKPETKTLTIAGGLLAVSSTVSLSMPFLWGRVIDVFTSPEQLSSFSSSLPTVVGVLTGVFLLGSGANTLRIILMHIAGQRIINRLRTSAFASIMRADISWHDLRASSSSSSASSNNTTNTSITSHLNSSHGTGDLVSRLSSDCHLVGDSITRDLADGTKALATVLAGVSMMFLISSKLTLVMLTVVPPTAIGAVFFGHYLKKLSRQTQVALAQITSHTEEKLNLLRAVHTFNAVPLEIKTFDRKAHTIFELARKEAYARGLFFGGSGFTGNATIIALLTYGGTLVSRGEISVGDLSSLMMYTAYVGSSLISLSSWFATLMKGLGASSRIFDLLDAKPVSVTLGQGRVLSPTEPLKPVVFKNVHFSYPARPHTPILKGLDLQITPGSSLAIAGSSGSGKSTLAYLLLRFYDPQSGGIFYGDESIQSFTAESWRSNIGAVPQDPALLSGTIGENIIYGISGMVAESKMREAARLANAIEFIESLPSGFETEVGPKGIQLSGGQRQRLAIARALVRDPKLLILDEATSALDTAAENEVNQAIQSVMNSGSLTTVIIAHRLSTLKTADRIVYMEDGKIVESGTYDELSREGTGFNLMIRSQLLSGGGRRI
ncbi:ATP-binding cassette permease mdl1 [Puccinia graminis f. sp. tritici]|uniref:ATP-binding cassette permease mdl1 n=1 Tax=Puccinia graminis f. sp. tritici TaxID=56615 RepID=A0A5B0R328_PUCGR|nr:ATP-binding cassette permease mdl1 [Puccinia graminis f. sp. tritici]